MRGKNVKQFPPKTGHREWMVHANDEVPKRWKAVFSYHDSIGTYELEELEELQEIVERGPDWNEINQIVVTLART